MSGLFGGGSSAPAPTYVNVPQTQQIAQQAAQQNVTGSQQLQAQIFPSLTAAQNTGINAVAGNLANPVAFSPASTAPFQSSPLLNQAAQYASSQLALGDQLPADVQAQVAQQAGAQSFASGLRGPGLADVTAADLGLNSLALGQQRFANAQSIGQTQNSTSLAQQQLQTSVNQFNSQYGANVAIQSAGLAQQGLNSLIGINPPPAGLSPGDIASLAVGNTNIQDTYNQQSAALSAQQQNANNQYYAELAGLAGTALTTGIGTAATAATATTAATAATGLGGSSVAAALLALV